MKKSNTTKTIIAIAITLITMNANAQNFYAKLNAGYNLGISTNSEISNLKVNGTVSNYENVNLSFGKGTSFGATFGYKFNKFIGSELSVNYLLGATTKEVNSTITAQSTENINTDYSAKMISFTTAIVITPGFDKFNPYARFGLMIGLPTATTKQELSFTEMGFTGNASITFEVNGGIAFGLQSAIGVSYQISEKISVFGEINNVNLSYSPTKGEVTEYKINGIDQLGSLETSEKKTEFVDSYSVDSSVSEDPNAPSKELAPNLPFSSFGLNLGIILSF